MYSNVAYEAFYQFLGLSLQERLRDIIVSESFFKMIILITFGGMFFFTTLRFFSRYMPSTLVKKKGVPLSKFVSIIFCLFLGLSLLKVNTSSTSLRNYRGDSWHTNSYIKANVPDAKESYKVNFVFDIVSRSAEEISALFSRIVDDLFKKTHSQLEAPDFFYKAVMAAGSATITDHRLKDQIDYYVDECFDRFMPKVGSKESIDKMDGFFFRSADHVDTALSELTVETVNANGTPQTYSCLDLKVDVRNNLISYASQSNGQMHEAINLYLNTEVISDVTYSNAKASKLLVNHFLDKHENAMGIHKGAQINGTTSKIIQYINKAFSWDGLLSYFDAKELHGSSMQAKRAEEFSQLLHRAPHLAGFIKLVLIACFPLLVFAVVAGRWKFLVYWFLIYLSVLLWSPIWTLFYHIVTNIGLATGLMSEFGKLYDGISLYSAQVVESRMYYMYSVYSWIQVIVGPLFTGFLLYFLRPMLADTQGENAPDAAPMSGNSNAVTGMATKAGMAAVGV